MLTECAQIEYVRRFNRFIAGYVGTLDDQFLNSDATLPEARVAYEIGNHKSIKASELSEILDMDRSNMSRIIAKLEKKGWVERTQVEGDARIRSITLTKEGREMHALWETRQREFIQKFLSRLCPMECEDLLQSLSVIRLLLSPQEITERETTPSKPSRTNPTHSFEIRPFDTGDISLLVSRQAKIYKESQGCGIAIESHIAETGSNFLKNFKHETEQAFVAEIDGAFAGGILITDEGQGVARIRMLHVEPSARRRGIGGALVKSCIDFAIDRRYTSIVLWTQTVLENARRIYLRYGFKLYKTAIHSYFGSGVQGEMWRLDLEGRL